MQFYAAAKTDAGLVKKVNQDAYHVAIAETEIGQVAMGLICDGVGGLAAGEVASSICVSAYKQWFETRLPKLIANRQMNPQTLQEELETVANEAHEKMLEYGQEKELQCGTTLSVLLLTEDYYYTLHIGDSRIYEIQNEAIQMTKDHTLLEKEKANPGEKIQMSTKSKHVLLQCLGVTEKIQLDFSYGLVKENCCYLICSDGLHNRCNMNQLCYDKLWDLDATVTMLIEEVKGKKERDNISVILFSASK